MQPEALVDDAQVLQRAEHEALVGEDELPADGADDEAREERHDHEQQQDVLEAPAPEGDGVGHRVADEHREHGHDEAVQERAQQLGLPTGDRLREDAEVPRQPIAGAERALLERDRRHRDQRDHEEDDQPQPARHQEQVRDEASAVAQPVGHRSASGRRSAASPAITSFEELVPLSLFLLVEDLVAVQPVEHVLGREHERGVRHRAQVLRVLRSLSASLGVLEDDLLGAGTGVM